MSLCWFELICLHECMICLLYAFRHCLICTMYHYLLFSGFLDKYHIGSDTLRFYCKLLQQKNICYWLHWSQCYSPTGKHVTLRILRPKNDCIMFDFTMSNSKIRLKIVQYKPGLTWGFDVNYNGMLHLTLVSVWFTFSPGVTEMLHTQCV